MPCALVGRIRFTEAGLPLAEYLHREETLFVEPAWSWVEDTAQAMIFPTVESAEEERQRQKEQYPSQWCSFAIVCGPSAESLAARDRREQDRIATALSSVGAERPGNEPGFIAPRGIIAQKLSTTAHRKERREADADAAVTRPVNGAARWKKIYREKVQPRHVSPAESYAALERRHLD